MASNNIIKLGTRGSKLALWQAYFLKETLEKGGFEVEIVIIHTKGDKILDRTLAKIGSKGVFTEELEAMLLSGEIDIAQHSAKDLQSDLNPELELIAFTEREKINDVLVSLKGTVLSDTENITIGTSSTRRVAMLKHFYPKIKTVEMRGNLQTRMEKLAAGSCDGILLAYAGVHRMAFDQHISEILTIDSFTPAVGQGSIAIECAVKLAADKKAKIRELCNHTNTEKELIAERTFLKKLQGGCSIPVFGLARFADNTVTLTGGIVSLDGKTLLKETFSDTNPEDVGNKLATKILEMGGKEILEEIKKQLS